MSFYAITQHWRAKFFCLIVMVFLYLRVLYPQTPSHVVPVKRNIAWNSLYKEVLNTDKNLQTLFKFLREHEHEERIKDTFDVETILAIDQAVQSLKKQERDLQTIRKEIEYKEITTTAAQR